MGTELPPLSVRKYVTKSQRTVTVTPVAAITAQVQRKWIRDINRIFVGRIQIQEGALLVRQDSDSNSSGSISSLSGEEIDQESIAQAEDSIADDDPQRQP